MRSYRRSLKLGLIAAALLCASRSALAAEGHPIFHNGQFDPRALIQAGGLIGYATIALSVAMAALVIEHLLSIRRDALMPKAQAVELQKLIAAGQLPQADQLCRQQPTLLSYIVLAGLQEASFGYAAVEKAMEDAAQEQAARLARKVDYLSVIGAISPMLGLTGTVWGMIQAFAEFAERANPTPTDFAPSISEALVTTLFGLLVAIPAMSAHAWFRNRTDEYVAETALLSERLMSPLRRKLQR